MNLLHLSYNPGNAPKITADVNLNGAKVSFTLPEHAREAIEEIVMRCLPVLPLETHLGEPPAGA
jgi:hypothetical protein